MRSINPATGEVLADYPESTPDQVESALDAVYTTYLDWSHRPVSERAEVVRALGKTLRARKDAFAYIMSSEMGKPIMQSRAEVEKSAACCDFYASEGPRMLGDVPVDIGSGARASVRYRPLGVVLALMPWNYPLWQLIRCAAPILMAGNTIVLKHAGNVAGSALLIEEAFSDTRPDLDLLKAILIGNEDVAKVIGLEQVAGVTLTGSEAAGVSVVGACAKHLKSSVLELGGSDPFLVLSGADVESAAKVASVARFQNVGQSCIAAKRMIVTREVADHFTSRLVEHAAALNFGDPMLDSTDVGPMARVDLRDELHGQVIDTTGAGATLALGGQVDDPATAYYRPTIVTGVRPGMRMFDEETFGPAAAVTVADDLEDAVRLANLSRYGLSSAAWSNDEAEIDYVREHIESGGLFVNGMTASDPRLPFGGIKKSGWGRELGQFGLHEFTNVQAYRRG